MKTTLLLLAVGYLGYKLYDQYNKTGSLAGAFNGSSSSKGGANNFAGTNTMTSGNNESIAGADIPAGIEAQMNRGEGMTNEAKVGIND